MYSCPLHQWNSYESPCPSCATTITTGGDLPLQIVVPATPSVNDPSVLKEALDHAVVLIRRWHDAYDRTSDKETLNQIWEIYYGKSPEMKIIREALSQYNALPGSQGGEKRKLQFMGKGLADVMDAAHNAAIKEAQIIVGQNLIPRHSVVEPIIKGILEKLEAIKRQSTLPNQIEDNSNFRGEVIGTIAYNPVSGDLRITPDPEPDQREDKTDMGVYENYQRETTIAQSLSSIEESGLKEGEDLGECNECQKRPATKDYNGHGYYVCDLCFNSLSNEFDEEYK